MKKRSAGIEVKPSVYSLLTNTVELVELVELILIDSMQFSGSVCEIMQVWQSMSGMACR